MLLEADGYDVIGEAPDGRSAIVAAQELDPDVILLDIQLPDIDGFEVSARLAANGDPPAVVMTSSRDAADYGLQAADSGARGFIAKSALSRAALEDVLR